MKERDQVTENFAGQSIGNQFIAGEWRPGQSARELTVIDPYSDETLVRLQRASATDVDAAYRAAESAQRSWALTAPAERRRIMLRAAEIFAERREEIAAWLVAEAGSTIAKAQIEIDLAIGITMESASFPTRATGAIMSPNTEDKEVRVYRRPLGVVGVISPWNFPLHLSQRSVAPALALGNAVVIKPASDTPVSGGLIIGKIFEEAGVPAGVINVVVGAGSEIGDEFVTHPVPRLISFTGSTPVGQRVGELAVGGPTLKKVALELGGNAPMVVLDDADLDTAVAGAVTGKFLHQGQICMAVNRIIVDSSVYADFIERYCAAVSSLKYGDPGDEEVFIGPVANDAQLATVREKIELARAEGARAVVDGETVGRVVPPHVFVDVTPDMELAQEEIFGPVVGVLEARDEAHALELANDHRFGLSSSVYTQNLDRGVQFGLQLQAGMTYVNEIPIQDEAHIAFGGEANSGLGRFNGEWAIEEFTTVHTIGVKRINEN